jgi:hypothetical protein
MNNDPVKSIETVIDAIARLQLRALEGATLPPTTLDAVRQLAAELAELHEMLRAGAR